MAPLPVTNTARLVVDYRHRDTPSKVLYRFPASMPVSEQIAAVEAFHVELRPAMLTNWSVPGTCQSYDEGETFSTEFTITPVASGTGGSDISGNPDAFRAQVLARSVGGRRVSWYLAGVAVALNQRQRYVAADVTQIAALLEAFGELIDVGGLTAIDNLNLVLKPYVNLVINDYLTQQSRRG